jgi:hypothetical protein
MDRLDLPYDVDAADPTSSSSEASLVSPGTLPTPFGTAAAPLRVDSFAEEGVVGSADAQTFGAGDKVRVATTNPFEP